MPFYDSSKTRGLLQVTGTIDISQFWPTKESDGDTVHVTVDRNGFKFSPDGNPRNLKTTHVFDHAAVHGKTKKTAISKGKITIRLEHIDAAELHYPPKNLRQYFGETAATKLHDLIAGTGQQLVHCKVLTAIDHPGDAFDTYGRLIGNIIIHLHGKDVNANHWMVQHGWAFPAFYNSALASEIKKLSKYAEEAKKAEKGIWKHLSYDVAHPDFSLVFRHGAPPDAEADIGPLVIPKLFRRQVAWHTSQDAGLSFREFLEKQSDRWVKMADFVPNGHVHPSGSNLGALVNDKGIFEAGPADIVFIEEPSALFDQHGKEIISWGTGFEKIKAAKGAA